MAMRSLYDDERIKMTAPKTCCCCSDMDKLSVDHLIPRIKGSVKTSDNLILACRSFDSSKQGRYLLEWMTKKDTFPANLLLGRYRKLVDRYCENNDMFAVAMSAVLQRDSSPNPQRHA